MLKHLDEGATSLKDLVAWPERHCTKLWLDPEHGQAYRNNFVKLFESFDIRVVDSYAGTGNASVTLKKAAQACASSAGSLG